MHRCGLKNWLWVPPSRASCCRLARASPVISLIARRLLLLLLLAMMAMIMVLVDVGPWAVVGLAALAPAPGGPGPIRFGLVLGADRAPPLGRRWYGRRGSRLVRSPVENVGGRTAGHGGPALLQW